MAFTITKLGLVSLLASAALAVPTHHNRHRHQKRDVVWETDIVTDVNVVTQVVYATVAAGEVASSAPAAAVAVTSAAPVALDSVTPTAAPAAKNNVMNWNMFQHQAVASSDVETYAAPSSTQAPISSAAPSTTLATVVSSTQAAVSSASASIAPSSGGKRGVAYNTASFTDLFTGSTFSWAYNWGCDQSGTILSGLEYVPMLWGGSSTFTSAWDSAVSTALASGSTHLLGFNEPDHTAQANMSPSDAAAAWKQYIQDYSSKAKLVSPAVTNGAAPMGLSWMSEFMDACDGCTFDAIAIHWYDAATNIEYFKSYVNDAYNQFKKPLWITEFGASGSDEQISTFLSEALPWLDSQDFVERYAYFMAADGQLLSGSGLSTYGKTYVDAS